MPTCCGCVDTKEGGQHIDGYEKHVRQRESNIVSLLFMVVPLVVTKILLLILLILTIQKLKTIRKHHGDQKPPHRSDEGKEKSRDSAELTMSNEPSKESTTPSKESVTQAKSL
ncbi:unnamed protein product [Cylicocyclus nassatus]|uniref:Uncharacterized protein n=1 Tax=Cylicocyclus nassatus TaxID=53992 RepID=A0AA36M6R2_CYLNA|nr:unnamed protein product [Cylicocyclus nassatus]